MEAVLFSVQVLPVQVMEEAVLVAQTQEVCLLVSLWKKNHKSWELPKGLKMVTVENIEFYKDNSFPDNILFFLI